MIQTEVARHLGCSLRFLRDLRGKGLINPQTRMSKRGPRVDYSEADIARARRLYTRNASHGTVKTNDPLLRPLMQAILDRYGNWSQAVKETHNISYNHLIKIASGDHKNPNLSCLHELERLAGGRIAFVRDEE